jgi:hypothetical protein
MLGPWEGGGEEGVMDTTSSSLSVFLHIKSKMNILGAREKWRS